MARFARKYRFEMLCLSPLVVFLLVFTLAPIVRVVVLSFQAAPGPGGAAPPTLEHYRDLLSQRAFREAFLNTAVIAGVSLALETAFGLIMALVLSRNAGAMRFLRPVCILPLAIPTAVVGVIMGYLFSHGGWINRILSDAGLVDSPVYWMSGGARSLFMVALADTWKVTPIVMLILLAGLESIETSLYRAARMDGAGSFYIFRRITVPLLMPAITAAVIIRGIDAFRIFALPMILMGQNLKVIGTYAYAEHVEYNNPYASAASSVVLLFMILAAVLIYVRVVGRKGMAPA